MEDTWFCRSVRERERSMFRLVWAMLRNEADCEDAVQSAILKAMKHCPPFGIKMPLVRGCCGYSSGSACSC